MIIQGGKAGNVGFWSMHLMRADTNESVRVTESRGVLASDLKGALREMQAIAAASRCGDDFMYQANINPRAHEQLTPEQWSRAIDALEHNLGFAGHARVVVEHVKEGRRHVHVVWSRVDEDLKTVSPFYNYKTHKRTARELEREFGLALTPERAEGPRPYALWEQERASQTGINPGAMKAELTQLWHQADTGQAFVAAVHDRGYVLARGDRRDFVVVDQAGTPHSLARRLDGITAKEVRAFLGGVDREALPSVAAARTAQRVRFPDATRAWESRPPVPGGSPTPRPEQVAAADEEQARRSQDSIQPALNWADRAGMVAQQASAMRWLERRTRLIKADATSPTPSKADRTPGAGGLRASRDLTPEKQRARDRGRDGPEPGPD